MILSRVKLTKFLFITGIIIALVAGFNFKEGKAQPISKGNSFFSTSSLIGGEMLASEQESVKPSILKVAIVKLDNNMKKGIAIERSSVRSMEELKSQLKLTDLNPFIKQQFNRDDQIERYSISASNQVGTLVEAIEWSIKNEIKVLDVPIDPSSLSPKEVEELETAKSVGVILIRKSHSSETNESTILDIDQNHLLVINNNEGENEASIPILIEEADIPVEESILLLLDHDPNLTHDQIYNLLTTSADPYGNSAESAYMVNTQRALKLLEMRSDKNLDSTATSSSSVSLQATDASPGLVVQNVSQFSAELNVRFPADRVYGNELEVFNYFTGALIFMTGYYTADGVYTVSNLMPDTIYIARMRWLSGSTWYVMDVNFKTLSLTSIYRYEYDVKGRLQSVKDGDNNTVATFIYDENGNLISIQK